MPAYHSSYNEEPNVRQIASISILPLNTRSRGPAPPPSTSPRSHSQFLLGNMQANIDKGRVTMMASLDHTMWFHNSFHMNDWLLMVVRALTHPDRKPVRK